jgi:CubicO group peptidase (beta-lactamase class C family)
MKKKFIVLITLLLAFVLFGSCSNTKKSEAELEPVIDDDVDISDDEKNDDEIVDDSRFDHFIETLKKDLEKSKAYGVSVAVMENGKVTLKKALGSKDGEGKEPLTTDTLMQIGSTTKQMTATALLQKIEEGKVGINDNFEKLLPEMEFKVGKEWGKEITVHHLLTHQGGFYDWTEWNNKADDETLYYTGINYAKKYFLMNPPGIFWNYSNPNFSFAGIVTEKLDSRFWSDIMREDVFLPLGMDRTYLRKKEVASDGDYAHSYGYRTDDLESGKTGKVDIDAIADSAFTRPAGLVWTTPGQMMKWAQFIIDGNSEVLSDDLRLEITKPQVDTLYGEGITYYGYGMMVEKGYMSKAGKWYEMDVWQHDGATISFTNAFYILPEQKLAISIISSSYGADFSDSLDAAITTLATLPEPSDPPAYTVDYDKFDDHTGTYHDPNNVGTMIITRDGNKLLISAPTLEEYGFKVSPELQPLTSDIFIINLNGDPYDITFIKENSSDKSVYMRNRIFVLTRTESPEETKVIPTKENVRKLILRSKMFPDMNFRRLIQRAAH